MFWLGSAELVDWVCAVHQGSRVKSFAASRDGRTAVIVLFDSTVAVWDMETMQTRCMLQRWGDRDAARVHSGGVNAVYMSADNLHAVTVSKDCTARIWDLESGECKHVLEGKDRILAVPSNSSGDGKLLHKSGCCRTYSAAVLFAVCVMQPCLLFISHARLACSSSSNSRVCQMA